LIAALVGAWLGHGFEYLRVWGIHGFAAVAGNSAHLYMVPMGGTLIVASVVGFRSCARLARRLERHLSEMRRPGSVRPAPQRGAGWSFAIPTLVLIVWLVQIGVYLVQENAEAVLAHLRAPGLGPVVGIHALAPLVHLAVTLALVTMVCLVRRRVTQLAAAVRAVDAWRRLAPPVAPSPSTPVRAWTPAQRWGAQRWCRPPPVVAGV
jgi:hypothetical protein